MKLQAIPENFTRNLPRKLPNTVTLKSPSGIKWEIGLTANDNSLFFEHGWKEFVKYHSLEENDILVFKYNGESHFDVLMFNGWSMCEKTACYFLRKHGPKEHDSGCQIKRESGKKSAGVVIGSCPKKKPKNKNIHTPLKQPVISKFAKNVTAGNKEPCDEDIEAKPGSFLTPSVFPLRRFLCYVTHLFWKYPFAYATATIVNEFICRYIELLVDGGFLMQTLSTGKKKYSVYYN